MFPIKLNSLLLIYPLLWQNNKVLLFHAVFVGRESQEWIRWVILAQISHEVAVKRLSEASVIWRLDWSWRIHFRGGCWLKTTFLTTGNSLWPYTLSRPSRATWVFSIHGSRLPPELWSKKDQGRNQNIFYNLDIKVMHYHCHHIWLVT